MDDVLFGADKIYMTRELRTKVIQLFKRGCFHLRKWASNNELLLSDCPSGTHERAFDCYIDEEIKLKVLSLQWYPTSDLFQFKIEYRPMEFPTQSLILSLIAELYDPLGWLIPVVIVYLRTIREGGTVQVT